MQILEPREYRLVVAALMRYPKEAPEVVSLRWKHAVDIAKLKTLAGSG